MPIVRELVRLSQAQIDAGGGQQDIDYMLDRPPYTRYYWNGESFASMGSTTNSGGVEYLSLSDGTLFPLSILAGTPHEPTVASVVQQVVELDHGSDADHVEILWTFNCTTGDPDTADTALASARFTDPESNAEVVMSGIIGATSGSVFAYSSTSFTKLHFALEGAGPYTEAAANTLTALEMVVMSWAASLEVNAVEIRVGTSTVGGGSNKRYRTITVTGYSA